MTEVEDLFVGSVAGISSHEGVEASRTLQGEGPPLSQLRNERPISKSSKAKARLLHASIGQESFNPLEELGVSDNQGVHSVIYIQRSSPVIGNLSSRGRKILPLDISNMSDASVKRALAARRAKALYRSLMALPRQEALSNNEWATRAKVNTSFFTNLRNGSEPSVGNLRAILDVIDVTLPEFFLSEARNRLVRVPQRQALEMALTEALAGLPRSLDRRASYLAEVMLTVLALPEPQPAILSDSGDSATEAVDAKDRSHASTRSL